MIKEVQLIDSAQSMISAIRKLGIVPLFHNPVKGWSIEELTAPGYWFTESNDGELGPWDWKIDASGKVTSSTENSSATKPLSQQHIGTDT